MARRRHAPRRLLRPRNGRVIDMYKKPRSRRAQDAAYSIADSFRARCHATGQRPLICISLHYERRRHMVDYASRPRHHFHCLESMKFQHYFFVAICAVAPLKIMRHDLLFPRAQLPHDTSSPARFVLRSLVGPAGIYIHFLPFPRVVAHETTPHTDFADEFLMPAALGARSRHSFPARHAARRFI